MILGLLQTEAAGLDRLKNFRRTVFYNYPNGTAPLIALLSMLKEESTNDPEFSIYEKRLVEQRTITAQANAAGPFTTTGGDTDAANPFTIAANGTNRIRVADSTAFRVGHIIQVTATPSSGAAIYNLKGIITTIVSGSTTKIEVRWLEAYTN